MSLLANRRAQLIAMATGLACLISFVWAHFALEGGLSRVIYRAKGETTSIQAGSAPIELRWTEEEVETTDYGELHEEWVRDTPITSAQPWTAYQAEPAEGVPYNATIVYLIRHSDLLAVGSSLETLAKHMPMEQAYPIMLLHDGDCAFPAIQEDFMSRWESRVSHVAALGHTALANKMRVMGDLLEWPIVEMHAPNAVARKGLLGLGDVEWEHRWPGYQSMCRFFATEIFFHHRVGQFEYYMRMDTDAAILSTMKEDPFRRMRREGLIYAWRLDGADPESVVMGLREFVIKYAEDHPGRDIDALLEENDLLHDHDVGIRFPAWFNPWEISHIPSFRQHRVTEWFKALNEHWEGFYKHRWGDAPLRRATTSMFFPKDKVARFFEFVYHHGEPVTVSNEHLVKLANEPKTFQSTYQRYGP